MGAGFHNPHLGDNVWPQLNFMFIIYCSEDEAEKITLEAKEKYKRIIAKHPKARVNRNAKLTLFVVPSGEAA